MMQIVWIHFSLAHSVLLAYITLTGSARTSLAPCTLLTVPHGKPRCRGVFAFSRCQRPSIGDVIRLRKAEFIVNM